MAHPLSIDLVTQDGDWKRYPKLKAMLTEALRVAFDMSALHDTKAKYNIALVLNSDAKVKILNRQYRGLNQPTNVLSFPNYENLKAILNAPEECKELGDVILAFETLAREAGEQAKDPLKHLIHLTVHGFLHLLGHDHLKENEAEMMESLEINILSRLNVANPYA